MRRNLQLLSLWAQSLLWKCNEFFLSPQPYYFWQLASIWVALLAPLLVHASLNFWLSIAARMNSLCWKYWSKWFSMQSRLLAHGGSSTCHLQCNKSFLYRPLMLAEQSPVHTTALPTICYCNWCHHWEILLQERYICLQEQWKPKGRTKLSQPTVCSNNFLHCLIIWYNLQCISFIMC